MTQNPESPYPRQMIWPNRVRDLKFSIMFNGPVINPSQRLFLALWPPVAVRHQLAEHARQWTWPTGAAPYQPEDWHVTLHFIGAVTADQAAAITAAAAVAFHPFDLVLDQPTLWPHGLAVLCPSEVPKQLGFLFDRLGKILRGLDLPVETRPYRPHLTLARRAAGAVAPAAPAPVVWPVQGYALVVTTGDKHARYQVIQAYFPLKAPVTNHKNPAVAPAVQR